MSILSDAMAFCRGVTLYLSLALTSTPASIKNFTGSRLPDKTAEWSRDSSLYPPLIWTSAPLSIRSLAMSILPDAMAFCRGVTLL